MTNVLVVKANNRPDGVSTMMYDTFVEAAAKNEALNVTTFDVFAENLPHYGQDLFDAFQALQAGEELTDVQTAAIEAQKKSQAAITEADVIVFAFPLWNLTIPSALLDFLNYSIQAGFSFKYTPEGQKEFLLKDKTVYLLNARGGYYNTPEMNALEMSVNYMKMVVNNYLGLPVEGEVIIEGHAQVPTEADAIIEAGMQKVKELVASLS